MNRAQTKSAAGLSSNRTRKFLVALAVAGAFTAVSARLHAQEVAEATCIEYPTAPGGMQYIGHFAYQNYLDIVNNLIKGNVGNLFTLQTTSTPGSQFVIPANQPSMFYPGYHVSFTYPALHSQQGVWTLRGSVGTLTPLGFSSASTASPTCTPAFVPTAALAYTQSGTYTHQYLGQVDAGPAIDEVVTVLSFSSYSNIAISNLIYVANDTANPQNSLNPNSIYGDVVVTGAPTGGASNIFLQLTRNGVDAVSGVVPITY